MKFFFGTMDPYEPSLSTGIHGAGTSLKNVCQLMSAYLPSPCLPTMQAMVIAVLHARPTSAGYGVVSRQVHV